MESIFQYFLNPDNSEDIKTLSHNPCFSGIYFSILEVEFMINSLEKRRHNPCFSGIYFSIDCHIHICYTCGKVSHNPCFSGIYFSIFVECIVLSVVFFRHNPCFSGIYFSIESLYPNATMVATVIILVLVESIFQ